MSVEKKNVYIAMSADFVHNGHINVIEEGAKYGDVIIGLLTDEVIASYKRMPLLDYETREKIFSNIKNVTKVVKQSTLDYTENLEKLKPDYVVHGDDWKQGIQSLVRENVIKTLAKWGGELIEVPYTKGVSCTDLEQQYRMLSNTTDIRRAKLRRLMKLKPCISVMEASNGLTGLIVEKAQVSDEKTATMKEFDAFSYVDDVGLLQGKREEIFAPIKNKVGVDSLETASKLYKDFYK